MSIKSNMTNITLFMTVFAVCASIATSAPITIARVSASVGGVSTAVGPIVLNDTVSYSATVGFELSFGSGANSIGINAPFQVKTNDNPGCNGLKKIKFLGGLQLDLPSTFTTPINTLTNALSSVVQVPSIADFSTGLAVSADIDVSSMTSDIDIKLSDKLPPSKKPALELLGTDITFRIAVSELKLFDGGVEIPLYVIFEVLAKNSMKLPTDVCGPRGANICGASCGLAPTTATAQCVLCDALCRAAGSVLDAVLPGNNNDALYAKTVNVAEVLEEVAGSSANLQGTVRTCAAASSKKCFGIGTTKKCPEPELSGATQLHLDIFAIAAVAFLAFMQ